MPVQTVTFGGEVVKLDDVIEPLYVGTHLLTILSLLVT